MRAAPWRAMGSIARTGRDETDAAPAAVKARNERRVSMMVLSSKVPKVILRHGLHGPHGLRHGLHGPHGSGFVCRARPRRRRRRFSNAV